MFLNVLKMSLFSGAQTYLLMEQLGWCDYEFFVEETKVRIAIDFFGVARISKEMEMQHIKMNKIQINFWWARTSLSSIDNSLKWFYIVG